MSLNSEPKKNRLLEFMKSILSELQSHAAAWPFMEPVNASEVADYYDVVKTPMDLSTIDLKIEKELYHTLDEFVADVQLVVDNCRIYNNESTQYYKCANLLEEYFKSRLRARQYRD